MNDLSIGDIVHYFGSSAVEGIISAIIGDTALVCWGDGLTGSVKLDSLRKVSFNAEVVCSHRKEFPCPRTSREGAAEEYRCALVREWETKIDAKLFEKKYSNFPISIPYDCSPR